MKRRTMIFIVIFLLLIILVASSNIIIKNNKQENKTTNTLSSSFKTNSDKLDFLEKYLEMPTKIIDAEYHIIFYDNSKGLIPGPSDWNCKVAIKLETSQIDKWIIDMESCSNEEINMTWWDGLSSNNIQWESDSTEAEYYKRPNRNSYIVVFRNKGIILKYFYTT